MLPIDFSLYLITDRHQTKESLLDEIQAALEGGIKAVQLREKDLSPREIYPLAVQLREMTQLFGAKLFINDRIDIALAIKADGVHLRGNSVPIPVARALIGEERWIGVSTHNLYEVKQAEAQGADFVTFGPIYWTPSKAGMGDPLGPQAIAKVKKETRIPLFSLGGVKKHHLEEVMKMGSDGIAVISALLGSDDVKNNTLAFQNAIQSLLKNAITFQAGERIWCQ